MEKISSNLIYNFNTSCIIPFASRILPQRKVKYNNIGWNLSVENGEDINVSDSVDLQETDATEVDTSDSEMLPQVSAAKNGARRRQSTVISLDRIEENLENDDGIEDVLSDDSEIDDEGKVGIIDEKS